MLNRGFIELASARMGDRRLARMMRTRIRELFWWLQAERRKPFLYVTGSFGVARLAD
jgi:hypothetical protein